MKILILGANGYIGNALLTYLKDKYDVVAFDLVFTGKGFNNIEYVTGDYSDIKSYSSLVLKSDIIINCIGLSGAANSIRDTMRYNRINIDAHLQFINYLFNTRGEKKLIFLSSRLVYGLTGNNIIYEEHECKPLDFYGIQKRTIEEYLRVYSMLNSNISVSIARLTNPYGYYSKPKDTPGYNFINSIIEKICKEQEVTIYGDGKQKRDYIHIHDVICAIESLLSTKESYSIYNVGYGESLSICEAIDIISNIVGKHAKIVHIDWPNLDFLIETGDCFVSNMRLVNIGWKPKYNFSSGISSIIRNIQQLD